MLPLPNRWQSSWATNYWICTHCAWYQTQRVCVYTTLCINSLDKIPFLLFHCRGVLENEVTNSTIDFEEINDATFCRSLSFATSLCQAILPNISLTGFKRWLTLMAAPFIGRVALGAVQIFLVIKLGTDPPSYPSLKLYRRPLVWKLFLSVVLSIFWVLHLSSGIVESTFNLLLYKIGNFWEWWLCIYNTLSP